MLYYHVDKRVSSVIDILSSSGRLYDVATSAVNGLRYFDDQKYSHGEASIEPARKTDDACCGATDSCYYDCLVALLRLYLVSIEKSSFLRRLNELLHRYVVISVADTKTQLHRAIQDSISVFSLHLYYLVFCSSECSVLLDDSKRRSIRSKVSIYR